MSTFPTTWVLVADCGRSRLFSWTSAKGDLEELEDAINPDARLREAALTSDRASSGHESHGEGLHATTPEHGAREQSSTEFARELAADLKSALNEGRYERLVLICPPEFLGILRGELDHNVCQLVAEVIGLDLTKHTPAEIRKRLPPLGSLG
jgi:protein required for attachment to host cells